MTTEETIQEPVEEREPGEGTLDPDRWVDEHGDAMFRYALVRLRNAELAEDMVQETFMAALKGAAGFRGKASERTWLIGILKRKIIDHYRKKWRERPASELAREGEDQTIEQLFDAHGHWKGAVAPWRGNPLEELSEKDFMATLQRCIEALPGRLGDAFTLRELEQMESKEICQVLDITATNFWAMLHRSRMRLRDCLTKNWFGGKR